MEQNNYFEQREQSEDEVIGNVENIVNDEKQWIKGEIFVGYF